MNNKFCLFVLFFLIMIFVSSLEANINLLADTTPPTVKVLSPNGSEIWDIASLQKIIWNATDDSVIVAVSVYYKISTSGSWIKIDSTKTGLTNPDTFMWKVPKITSNQVRVKVCAYDFAGNKGVDSSDADFSIRDLSNPIVRVISPNGGEIWSAGSSRTISYIATDSVGVTRVSAYYTTNGINYTKIDSVVGNSGSFVWVLPQLISNTVKVKVCGYDSAGNKGSDTSDANFSIIDTTPPSVTVLLPNGGEVWNIGSFQRIIWRASDNIGLRAVSVYYQVNSTSNWIKIDSLTTGLTFTDTTLWQIPKLITTQARVKVNAYDWSGNSANDVSNAVFAINDLSVPIITVLSAPTTASRGDTIPVSVRVADNYAVKSVALKYAEGGSGTFTIAQMTYQSSTNQWNGRIPSSVVADKGVAYKFTATDSANLSSSTKIYGVSVGNVSITLNYPAKVYSMISIPITPSQTSFHTLLTSNLGNQSDITWRMFAYRLNNLGSMSYKEELASSSLGYVRGEGYWLFSVEPAKIVVAGTAPSPVDTYSVTLRRGWNLIGTPNNFRYYFKHLVVKYGNYRNNFGVDTTYIRPYYYYWVDTSTDFVNNGRWISPNVSSSIDSTLAPGRGYFIYSQRDSVQIVFISPIIASGASGMLKSVASVENSPLWNVDISAISGMFEDNGNKIGISSQSKDGYDRYDREKPPAISDVVSISFPHFDWGDDSNLFSEDYRFANNDEKIWNMRVNSSANGDIVDLSWKFNGELEEGFYLHLIDIENDLVVDMVNKNNYSFIADKNVKDFKVVYTNSLDSHIRYAPDKFYLSQNYPNPFNPETIIKYAVISKPLSVKPNDPMTNDLMTVSLKIYNITGQLVRTLVNEPQNVGYYSVKWDGKDDKGADVPSGIYMYNLHIGGNKVNVFNETKKMILLK